MSYKRLKLKFRVLLAGHIVAMVIYCATELTATCSPIIGQLVDIHDVGINKYRVVIMTHQTLSFEKYWKMFSATLKQIIFEQFMIRSRHLIHSL